MNILMLYWGRKGGGARYSLELAKEMARLEHVKLHVSVSKQCDILAEFTSLALPVHYVETYQNTFGFLKKFTAGRYNLQRSLENYLRENQITHVIIGMDFFWNSIIYKACKNIGAKTVYVVHEPKPHPREPLVMATLKKATLQAAITGAGHTVALTNHVKNYMINTYKLDEKNVSVIPHGVFSYYKATAPKSFENRSLPITLLYFGRIEYYKGLDILLEAYQAMENNHENICLEIWGSGDLSKFEKLIHSVRNIRIENRWVGEKEIPDIFKRADICVLPYRDASQSGVVGIASDAAVPVVACPSGGLKEQLKDTGAVFSDDFTPQALSASIEKLLAEPDTYHSLSKKSLDYVKNLRWPVIAEEFKQVCQKI